LLREGLLDIDAIRRDDDEARPALQVSENSVEPVGPQGAVGTGAPHVVHHQELIVATESLTEPHSAVPTQQLEIRNVLPGKARPQPLDPLAAFHQLLFQPLYLSAQLRHLAHRFLHAV